MQGSDTSVEVPHALVCGKLMMERLESSGFVGRGYLTRVLDPGVPVPTLQATTP